MWLGEERPPRAEEGGSSAASEVYKGQLYARARYYDPATARFLSPDPWSGDAAMPPSLNKYLYAYQNPTVYVDPDGRFPVLREMTDELARWRAQTTAVADGLEDNGLNVPVGASMGLGSGLLGLLEFGAGALNTAADVAVTLRQRRQRGVLAARERRQPRAHPQQCHGHHRDRGREPQGSGPGDRGRHNTSAEGLQTRRHRGHGAGVRGSIRGSGRW
mgnify:CR=1 FL=1